MSLYLGEIPVCISIAESARDAANLEPGRMWLNMQALKDGFGLLARLRRLLLKYDIERVFKRTWALVKTGEEYCAPQDILDKIDASNFHGNKPKVNPYVEAAALALTLHGTVIEHMVCAEPCWSDAIAFVKFFGKFYNAYKREMEKKGIKDLTSCWMK